MQNEKVVWRGPKVESWARFHRCVKPGRKLLGELERYPDPLLVAGCQRSGTTAVARMLSKAEGVADHRFGVDDELDAALLLCGYAELPLEGRPCFQTTYLNDRVFEYFEHGNFRLLWIVREPRAVVHSMLNNWSRAALRRLYNACGRESPTSGGALRAARALWQSSLDKACAAYSAKTAQTFELAGRLPENRLLVVEYNDMVLNKEASIPALLRFADLPYRSELLETIHTRSAKREPWSGRQAERVDELCRPVYERACALALRFGCA